MPQDKNHKIVQLASDKLFAASGNKVILLVEGDDRRQLLQAAAQVEARLGASSAFHLIDDTFIQHQSDLLLNTLSSRPFNFLSEDHRQQLSQGNVSVLLNDAHMALFDLVGADGVLPPDQDPVGLFNDWFSSAYAPPENILREDGFLFISGSSAKPGDNTKASSAFSILIVAELVGDALGTNTQEHVIELMSGVYSALPEGVTLSRSGMIFHAAETAAKAKQDIMLVAIGSTIGIVVLFLFAFISPMPLLVSLSSIFFGCAAGAIITHALFGELHVFTLVFGASLIGVAVDYSLHFFASLYYQDADGSLLAEGSQSAKGFQSAEGLQSAKGSLSVKGTQNTKRSAYETIAGIFPEISAGLLTSLVGFGCLLQSTLPGLDQIALFSMVGLASSWLFVVVLYPRICGTPNRPSLVKRFRSLSIIAMAPSVFWQRLGLKRVKTIYILLFVFAIATLWLNIQWSNDIRSLNVSSPELLQEEARIRQKLQRQGANQFFIVAADSPQALLREEEVFSEALTVLTNTPALQAYDAVSSYLPSEQRQIDNYQLIAKTFFSDSRVMETFMQGLGFSAKAIHETNLSFENGKNTVLTPEQWLKSASPELAMLWLGNLDGRYASIIALQGVSEVVALEALASRFGNVLFVDKVADISLSLSSQRDQAGYLLALAYFGIACLLLLRFRRAKALLLIVVPLLASLLTVAVLSLLKIEIGLFHLFGLFLVLGLGMDYGIFLTGPSSEKERVLVAVFLSAITSCLSFGLLSLSSIPMINAFGGTILLGSLFNLLLVPLVSLLGETRREKTKETDVGDSDSGTPDAGHSDVNRVTPQ